MDPNERADVTVPVTDPMQAAVLMYQLAKDFSINHISMARQLMLSASRSKLPKDKRPAMHHMLADAAVTFAEVSDLVDNRIKEIFGDLSKPPAPGERLFDKPIEAVIASLEMTLQEFRKLQGIMADASLGMNPTGNG
jgi:hypothetical protein